LTAELCGLATAGNPYPKETLSSLGKKQANKTIWHKGVQFLKLLSQINDKIL
jgi:hypothetical protein